MIPDVGITGFGGTEAEFRRQVDLSHRAGVRWLNIGVSWEALETTPDEYRRPGSGAARRWDELERRLGYARSTGMRVLLRASNAPAWASGRTGAANDPPQPVHLPAYGEFLGDLAERMRPFVAAYSPWNEPNIDGFWMDPDPAAYAALQKVAYRALKRADPRSIVLSAPIVGVNQNAFAFLRGAYAAGMRGHLDRLGWDAYPLGEPERAYRDPNGQPGASSLPGQRYLANILRRLDPGRKVWLMEISWSTCVDCGLFQANAVPPAVQADYLTRLVSYRRRYLSDTVERVFWYSMRDTGRDATSWTHNQGLLRNDLRPKPAYRALLRLSRTGGHVGVGLPRWRPLGAPARGRAASGRARVAVTGMGAATRRTGQVLLAARMEVRGGPSNVFIDAYDGRRWRQLTSLRLGRSSTFRVTITDRAYSRLRVRATVPGRPGFPVARVVRATR